MSTSVLEKLKVKPMPKKIEQILVKLVEQEPQQKEEVEIKTKIIDKTKDNLVDMADFRRKLKTVVSTQNITEKAPVPISIAVIDTVTEPPKKVKKITKKLRLDVEKSSGQIREPDTRRTPKPKMDVIVDDIDLDTLIGDAKVISRLPPKKSVLLEPMLYMT